MARVVKMIVVAEEHIAETLKSEKRLHGLDTMPNLNKEIKKAIREYIHENVGYDDLPIAGLSKYNGAPSDLRSVGTSINEFIPINPSRTNVVMFELHVPSDMVVSISFEKLLEFSNLIDDATDSFDIELYLEDFVEQLQKGYPDGDEEIISFIPFIDLQRCKFYSLVGRNWEMSDFNLPGVEKVSLSNMAVF